MISPQKSLYAIAGWLLVAESLLIGISKHFTTVVFGDGDRTSNESCQSRSPSRCQVLISL